MISQEQIAKAWELLEVNWSEQFLCITSVSWESDNNLIVTLDWGTSGQVRMILNDKKGTRIYH